MISQIKRLVILAAPRTGSNMLASLLNSHGDILCHHELFNPSDIFYALPLRNTTFSFGLERDQRDRHPIEFLQRVWRRNEGCQWVGFKMTHRQNPVVFNAVLDDHRVQKIVLKRRNGVKRYVSRLIAEQSGVWERYAIDVDQKHDHNRSQVTVDLTQLRREIELNRQFYEDIDTRLNESQQAYLQVDYEDLADDSCHQNLCQWLNVERQALNTQSLKQNPTDLSLNIKNFNQLITGCTDDALREQLLDTQS